MPYSDIVSTRCDGERIEVLVIRDGKVVAVKVSPERALRLAHDLIGHALQMTGRQSPPKSVKF